MPRKPSFSVQHRVLSFSLQHLAQSHHTTPRSQRPPDSCLTAPCTRPSFMPLLLLSSSPISSVLLAHVLYIDVIKRIPFSQKSLPLIFANLTRVSQSGITCQDYLTCRICCRGRGALSLCPTFPSLCLTFVANLTKADGLGKQFLSCSKPATVEPRSAHIYFFHSLTCCLPIQQSRCILQCAPGIKNEFPNCC